MKNRQEHSKFSLFVATTSLSCHNLPEMKRNSQVSSVAAGLCVQFVLREPNFQWGQLTHWPNRAQRLAIVGEAFHTAPFLPLEIQSRS